MDAEDRARKALADSFESMVGPDRLMKVSEGRQLWAGVTAAIRDAERDVLIEAGEVCETSWSTLSRLSAYAHGAEQEALANQAIGARLSKEDILALRPPKGADDERATETPAS